MRLPCKTKTEKAWLIISLSVLFLHRMLEATVYGYYSPATIDRLLLEASMIILSFPLGGLLMFALRDALSWCDACGGLVWMLDWPTMLLAGYIQWFWVLPEILRGRQLTFLNLRQPEESISPDTAPASSLPAHKVSPDASPAAATTADSLAFMPAAFDEAGRSALDRVLQAEWSAPPASPAHGELIFPSVR